MAAYVHQFAPFPLVIVANRDEFYARPATPPEILNDAPRVVGPRDVQAGGTWIGVNEHGLAAGILNRSTPTPDPERRSRGLLCLDVLRCRTLSEALAAVAREDPARYNPFNLLLATAAAAYVIHNFGGSMHLQSLPAGVHLLTNLNLNDFTCPRIAGSYELFAAAGRGFAATGDTAGFRRALAEVLSNHDIPLDPRDAGQMASLCIHGEVYGTRSSTLLMYSAELGAYEHWFADGPPCRTPFVPVSITA